jgi:NADH dehydrogenase [ubiquinone] 1 alpha subcomplex assembly factor 7
VAHRAGAKGGAVTALLEELKALIALEGPISVERYMALCLGHPQHGYYMTRDPLGQAGDFTTAPEISQMFGELVGLFMAQCWLDLRSPAPVQLVECGPGRGTLMADALRATRIVPGFREAVQVALVETSPVLKAQQRRLLGNAGVPLTWSDSLDHVAAAEPMLLIANEFLDALPIRQYIRQGARWHERLVGLDGNRLAFGLSADAEGAIRQEAPDGSVLEVAVAAIGFIRDIAARLKATGGVALFIDYGHVRSGFGDTLQAMRGHAFVDPLASPGEADLTAHVDFDALAKVARAAGIAVHGPVEQGQFLKALGLEARAAQLAKGDAAEGVRAAERRLTEMTRTGMGQLFKVMALTAAGHPVPPGFA